MSSLKCLLSSSLSQLWDQSDWSLQITGSYFIEASLHLVTMCSLYRAEALLKSSNHSWCVAVQSLDEHVEHLTWYICPSVISCNRLSKSIIKVNPSVCAAMMRSGLSAVYLHCVLEWNLQSKQTWCPKSLQVCELPAQCVHSNTLTWELEGSRLRYTAAPLCSEQEVPTSLYTGCAASLTDSWFITSVVFFSL